MTRQEGNTDRYFRLSIFLFLPFEALILLKYTHQHLRHERVPLYILLGGYLFSFIIKV